MLFLHGNSKHFHLYSQCYFSVSVYLNNCNFACAMYYFAFENIIKWITYNATINLATPFKSLFCPCVLFIRNQLSLSLSAINEKFIQLTEVQHKRQLHSHTEML